MSTIKDLEKVVLEGDNLNLLVQGAYKGARYVKGGSEGIGYFYNKGQSSAYYCRESNMNIVSEMLTGGNIKDAPNMFLYSKVPVGKIIVEYFNRVEEIYGFTGTRTSLMVERDIPKRYLYVPDMYEREDGETKVGTLMLIGLRVADEWHMSPTLYQLFNLLVRYIVMSENGRLGDFMDMGRWTSGEDILTPFDSTMGEGSKSRYYVSNYFSSLKNTYHVLLSQRYLLFDGTIEEEWEGDTFMSHYGATQASTLFSGSGTLSFNYAIKKWYSSTEEWRTDKRSINIPSYFKWITKYKKIHEALNNCGLYTEDEYSVPNH